jgi:hypothetical protein
MKGLGRIYGEACSRDLIGALNDEAASRFFFNTCPPFVRPVLRSDSSFHLSKVLVI